MKSTLSSGFSFFLWLYLTKFVCGQDNFEKRILIPNIEHRGDLEPHKINFHIPHILQSEYDIDNKIAEESLSKGMKNPVTFHGDNNDHPFADIIVDVQVPDAYAHRGEGVEGDKFFIGPRTVKEKGSSFVVYSFGCADSVNFELYMAKLGSSVFAFDCTVKKKDNWNSFTFNPWCLGKPQSFENNVYSQSSADKNFTFYQLPEIKKTLNHRIIDIFKMDIEGFEWDILENEIVKGKKRDLPNQLLFELHTQGANPLAVPKRLVDGKTRNEVNILIHQLRVRGYRCASVAINPQDRYCAEIVMVKVD